MGQKWFFHIKISWRIRVVISWDRAQSCSQIKKMNKCQTWPNEPSQNVAGVHLVTILVSDISLLTYSQKPREWNPATWKEGTRAKPTSIIALLADLLKYDQKKNQHDMILTHSDYIFIHERLLGHCPALTYRGPKMLLRNATYPIPYDTSKPEESLSTLLNLEGTGYLEAICLSYSTWPAVSPPSRSNETLD